MQLFNNKTWQITLLFTLMFSFWDFTTRIITSDEETLSLLGSSENYDGRVVNFTNAQAQSILNLYENYDKAPELNDTAKPAVVIKKAGLTQEQQNEQQGKLDKFYIGENTYSLSGIFSEHSQFAVLIQKNINSNHSQEIKVVLNQEIPPYKISKITESLIEFTLAQRTITLSLF